MSERRPAFDGVGKEDEVSETGLYGADFALWSERQGRLLREAAARRANEPIDWENLAEEIESLGRSERDEVASRVRVVLIHLLKAAASPAEGPRRGWDLSIREARRALRRRLIGSPSLVPTLDAVIADEWTDSVETAALELEQHHEIAAAAAVRARGEKPSPAEILGDEG